MLLSTHGRSSVAVFHWRALPLLVRYAAAAEGGWAEGRGARGEGLRPRGLQRALLSVLQATGV